MGEPLFISLSCASGRGIRGSACCLLPLLFLLELLNNLSVQKLPVGVILFFPLGKLLEDVRGNSGVCAQNTRIVKCKAVSTDGGNFGCVFVLLRGSFHFVKKRKKKKDTKFRVNVSH